MIYQSSTKHRNQLIKSLGGESSGERMIDKDKLGFWRFSSENIESAVDYINTLPLTEAQFSKLQELFKEIAEEWDIMIGGVLGEDL